MFDRRAHRESCAFLSAKKYNNILYDSFLALTLARLFGISPGLEELYSSYLFSF